MLCDPHLNNFLQKLKAKPSLFAPVPFPAHARFSSPPNVTKNISNFLTHSTKTKTRFLAAVAFPLLSSICMYLSHEEWKSCGHKQDKIKIKTQGAAGRRSGVIKAVPSSLAHVTNH